MMYEALNEARSQALKHLDPFQDNPQADRLRAYGLHSLYLTIADPSLKSIESIVRQLANVPFANLEQLGADTYVAAENPEQFFIQYGIPVEDPRKIQSGVRNFDHVLNDLRMRYDIETGELNDFVGEFNPTRFSEAAYEYFQLNKGEQQLDEAIADVKAEPNLELRYRKGINLRRQVLSFIGDFDFRLYPRYNRDSEPFEPTWQNLVANPSFSADLQTKDGGSMIGGGGFGINEAVDVAQATLLRYRFEQRAERIPKRDKEQFNALRFQYGAKAANLLMLTELTRGINGLWGGRALPLRIVVPEFKAVPVDTYKTWMGGKLSDADLSPYFDWASGLIDDNRWWRDEKDPADYIIRSSAVFSEDGEKATGAGVYDSVRVYGGSEFKDFKDAVVKVYESTESPQARAYRAQYGIYKEEMGLVIQKYAVSDRHSFYNQSNEGYVNSSLPGTPQLYEVVTGSSRNFIRRDELDFFLALDADHHEDAFRRANHFRPDIYKVDEHLPVRIAQAANVIEKLWGGDIQMEFVYNGPVINIVQVRDLPSSAQPEVEIQFPDKPVIHTGASVGFGDMDLLVLSNKDDNSEKSGVVVFSTNEMFSMGSNSYHLPKEGAVIITRLGGYNGHIQTLCAERGLICIFPDINNYDEISLNYGQLSRLGKVRVVSNGIEGRLYRSDVANTK